MHRRFRQAAASNIPDHIIIHDIFMLMFVHARIPAPSTGVHQHIELARFLLYLPQGSQGTGVE
jgi:hypothetical protein